MLGFEVQNGELIVAGMRLERLAQSVGQTPFYVYDRARMSHRVQQVREALPEGVSLHYAVKANPMPALLSHMAGLVDGMDVASGLELQAALNAGCCADSISFAGPGKSESELRQAVASGVVLHVESFRELALLSDISASMGVPARVAIRINPDFEARAAGMRMGGGAQAFGVDIEQVPDMLARIHELDLSFEGFHVYAGSQMLKADVVASLIDQSVTMLLGLQPHLKSAVRQINLGGGWGIAYFPNESALSLAPITQALAQARDRLKAVWPTVNLHIELGRYLVGEAGLYVARVLERKVSRGEVFLVTDGGLHHHLAATGNFGQVIRRNYPLAIANRMTASDDLETVTVVGPLCTPLDVLGQKVSLPKAQAGDLVVVFQSGAYGATASPQAFLSHPAVREILR